MTEFKKGDLVVRRPEYYKGLYSREFQKDTVHIVNKVRGNMMELEGIPDAFWFTTTKFELASLENE